MRSRLETVVVSHDIFERAAQPLRDVSVQSVLCQTANGGALECRVLLCFCAVDKIEMSDVPYLRLVTQKSFSWHRCGATRLELFWYTRTARRRNPATKNLFWRVWKVRKEKSPWKLLNTLRATIQATISMLLLSTVQSQAHTFTIYASNVQLQ